jgi:hypothetical protein
VRTLLWVAQIYVAIVAVAYPLLQRYATRRMLEDGMLMAVRGVSDGERARRLLELENKSVYMMPYSTIFNGMSIVVPRIFSIHQAVAPVCAAILALPMLVELWKILWLWIRVPFWQWHPRSGSVLFLVLLMVPHGFVIWGRLGPYPP